MTIRHTISQLANQCVLCGLCIPHCPTYHVFQTENESPRGRIILLKALAEEDLECSDSLVTAIDHCLGCRACEKMCPSQVNYSTLNSLGRELIANLKPHKHQPLQQKMAEKVLLTPALHPLLKIGAKSFAPLQQIFSHKGKHSPITSLTQQIAINQQSESSLQTSYPANHTSDSQNQRKKVILFKGCSGDLFEQQTLLDSILLLNACNFDVITPEKQQCCGAIKVRHGDSQGLKKLARKNIHAFAADLHSSKALISINNSCSGQLKEYSKIQDVAETEALSKKATDIIAFLAQELKNTPLHFAPLAQEVAVHVSCSLKNVLRQEDLLFELLHSIPDIHLRKLDDKFCCGAAGSYSLQYPEVSNRLLDDKIADVMQQPCDIIVSSNIGCSLHFKQGLETAMHSAEVIHPVHLLARQLIR